MRAILVPLSGETHDRAALAAAYHVARPFSIAYHCPVRTTGTGRCDRRIPVNSTGMVDRVTRAGSATPNDGAKLARQGFGEARTAADAALADRPKGPKR